MSRLHIKRTLLTGVIAVIPLCVTWIVFAYIFVLLSHLGTPLVGALAAALAPWAPAVAGTIHVDWVTSLLALLLTLLAFYALGWAAHRVVGRRLLAGLDAVIRRVPLVRIIYDGAQKLVSALQTKPGHGERVVLVDFPRRGLKAVGLVTRVWNEPESGRRMASVFVPTTPNPTSGYLQILPADELVTTDWTVDQAMALVISGGAVAPDHLPRSTTPPAS